MTSWEHCDVERRCSDHGAGNMCCGDGVSLTFLAVMACLLIVLWWCGVQSPHVPLILLLVCKVYGG